MKKVIFISLLFFVYSSSPIFAQQDYVLPYPSFMPGSKFYLLSQVQETISNYWYFGNFGQFTYALSQSDKYLVEAKTLCEYQQYFLAKQALDKSNTYFLEAPIFLTQAKKEGKNIQEKQELLQSAARKHIAVLQKLQTESPKKIVWQPENQAPVTVDLSHDFDQAMDIRKTQL